MKQTVYFNDFHQAFKNHDRASQFSYEGLELIYDYLISYEDDTNEELELDVIAICCEYSELSVEEIIRSYSIDADEVEDDEIDQFVMNFLCDCTTVIGQTDAGIVFQQF